MERERTLRPVVVITGASAGIGRAAIRHFAAAGWDVGLIARGLNRLEAAAREVEERGGRASWVSADVADASAIEHAAEKFERELGPIRVWVNCAMATIFSTFETLTAAEYRRATEVTYLGYVHGTMAALKRMRARDDGTIVQVGSALAYRAIPLQSVYCGVKFAIRGFTDSLRSELMHDRSRVHLTMVQMPAVNTPQFDWARNKLGRRPQPVPPIYASEVAAEAIFFAAHARRREVWVGTSTLKAILVNKLVPSLLDRYLGHAGYEAQLTDESAPTGLPGNLDASDPHAHGAEGRFTAVERRASPELWLARHRNALLALGAAGALATLALYRRRTEHKPDNPSGERR